MLKKDTKGKFLYTDRGFFKKKRYYRFCSGEKCTQGEMTKDEHISLLKRQQNIPVILMYSSDGRKRWWMFKGKFYWEDEGYTSTVIKALILERIRKKHKKIQRAVNHMRQEESTTPTDRKPIPGDVKIFVWRRDGGRCVKCGSRENLEFDHIIPISKGGSNTARNIQILCEKCNRSKGGNLT